MSWVDEYKKALGDIQTRTSTGASTKTYGSSSDASSDTSAKPKSSSSSWVNEYRNSLNKYNSTARSRSGVQVNNLVNVSSRLTDRMTVGKEKKDEDKQEDHPVKDKVDSRLTVDNKKDEEEDKDKKWYQKGHFEDGYDFGDLTKTILGIESDTTSEVTPVNTGTFSKGGDWGGSSFVNGSGKTYGDSVPGLTLEGVQSKIDHAETHEEQLKWQNIWNQKYFVQNAEILSNAKMDGTELSVLEEMSNIAQMEKGKDKEQRKKAVLAKMEELGIDTADYAIYSGDKNFTWENFGNWVKYSASAGLGSFNKMFTDTADVLLGAPLKELGWENNPVSKLNEYYTDEYESFKFNQKLYAEKLGGGAWNFVGDAVEGTVAAVPSALLAMMTGGTSLTATSSSLATNAAYQTGSVLTKAGITAETMMKNPQYWTSFAQSLGPKYKEAKEKGVNDSVAAVGAVISSMLTSGIEIGIDGGSGIQGLPSDLLEEGGNKFWKLLESAFEEGGEEGLQKLVEEGVSKFVFGLDEDYLNPIEYGRDIALGSIAGFALGSGQVALQSAVDAKTKRNTVEEDSAPVVEQIPKDEQEIKPEAEEVKPVVEQVTTSDVDHVLVGEPYYPGQRPTVSKTENVDPGKNTDGGFLGGHSGATYNSDQAILLSELSSETLQNAVEVSNSHDVLFDTIGLEGNDSVKQKWIESGLVTEETDVDGNHYYAVNSAALFDEIDRRNKVEQENNLKEVERQKSLKEDEQNATLDFDIETSDEVDRFIDERTSLEKQIKHLKKAGRDVSDYQHLYNEWARVNDKILTKQFPRELQPFNPANPNSTPVVPTKVDPVIATDENIDLLYEEKADMEQRLFALNDEQNWGQEYYDLSVKWSAYDKAITTYEEQHPSTVEPVATTENDSLPVSEAEVSSESTDSETEVSEFDRLTAQRDSLQETLMDRYNKQVYDEETERLATEWIKLNRKIESMKAEQSSVEVNVESNPAVETADTPVADVEQEVEKPKTTAEKARDYYRDSLLSFDRVFPIEEKTPEKVARFESLKGATKDAQDFIANGADGVKPVADIFRKVSEDGSYGDFELYLRHLLNIDRTTRNERFGKEDMPVFGEEEWKDGKRIVKWFTTVEQSREKVAEFEKAHPEFIQNREDVYAFFDHLKQMLVDSGRITQETADRWAEIDPHYIAISRGRHEQVSDKLFRFLNSGFGEYTFKEDGYAEFEKDIITAEPLYSIRATGEDFHSLIDTMVDRALRTFWTVADTQYEEASKVAPVQSEADVTTDAPIDPSVETNSDTEITQEEFDSLNELGQDLVEEESLKEETPVAPSMEENQVHDAPIDPSVETNEETDTSFEDELDEDLDTDDDLQSNPDEDVEIEQSPERRDDLLHDRLGLMGFLDIFVLDEGLRFEIMSKKEGNSLDAYWHAIGNSFSAAQHFIGNGNNIWNIESVKSVVDKVTSKKLDKTFNTYLLHLRNIDNMTLKSRYVVAPNDYSIGLPLHESYNAIRNIKAQNPEVDQIALGLYENADYIRNQFVEHKMLSEGQAELWQELFPNWLPFRRDNANYRKFMDGVKNLREHNIISPTTATKMQEFFLKNIPHAEKGGKARPMLETMAQYTSEAFNAWSMNDFAVQLKDTLHSEIKREDVDIREFIKRLDSGVGLIDLEKKKNTYTCTCYENGEKVTFKIDKEMYLALNNTKSWMDWKIPVLHQVNEGFRKFCTEWNIFFASRNAPKDLQEVIYNSQHPMETYCELINAANEIANNGVFYQEYLANGGESITYFDPKKFSFNSSTDVLEICKFISGVKMVETVNNRVETLPRFAEFIASRKMGRSVQEAMLDSARVTVNFQAGGKFTKFLNRNGCTFLNASFQGALQHVRNFANAATDADGKIRFDSKEAKLNVVKGITGYIAKGLAYGLTTIAINDLFWGDDEEYEELSDYVREGYYLIAKLGDGHFIRIPKGRTNEAVEEGIRTVAAASSGDDEADWKHFFDVIIENIAPNNPLSKNIFAPIIEVAKGETWYGEEMTPYRLKDKDTVDQLTEKTDIHSVEWSKMLEESDFDEWLAGTYDLPIIGNWIKNSGFADGLSPIEINYLINSYTGVLGDTVLPYFTPKAESPYDDPFSKSLAPFRDIFTTDSVLNNKATDDFYDTMEIIEAQALSENATLEDKFKNGLMIGYNVEISDLYEKQREIQMDNSLKDSEKYELTREIKKEIIALQEKGLAALEDYSIDGNYAEAGDKRYNYDSEDDTWWEVKPKLADGRDNWYYTEEQMFHDNLGVSYSDYWNGRLNPEDYEVKTLYDERNGKRYNFDMNENAWFEIKPKTKEGKDNYYYQREQTAHNEWGVSYEDFWNNREAYLDAIYVAENGVDKGWGTPYFETVKSAIGLDTFTQIASDMANISGQNRKRDMQNYIYSLDIPEVQKHILFKAEYPYTDKHNWKIINYLNEREDISYDQMESILTELGFKVDKKGRITW